MKKARNLLISLVLCLSVLLSLASCDLFTSESKYDKGYTGGFEWPQHFRGGKEIHWVETFEEAMLAIEHLEAAGNILPRTILSSYENDVVDAKYCFILNTYKSEKPGKGQEWYDRKTPNNIKIDYYGFLDKISISELEYSFTRFYKYIYVISDLNDEIESDDKLTYVCDQTFPYHKGNICAILEESSGSFRAGIGYYNVDNHLTEIPENFHEEFIKSIVYIGDKDK